MTLQERADLYRLLVKFSTEEKDQLRQSAEVENVFDKAAVEILIGAKRRGEHFDLLDLIGFNEI